MASPRYPPTIKNLPCEVLSEIFVKLLAKQLAQMRSVCKPWNALLSDSDFIKSHLNHSIQNNNKDEILLFFDRFFSFDSNPLTVCPSRSPDLQPPNFIKVPVNPQFQNGCGIVIGSVHGLICFSYSSSFDDFGIYIWNPSLSAVLTLPPSSFPVNDLWKTRLRFGYDPKTDDYKVVNLTTISKSSPQTEVYSMRKGSWELISQTFPCLITSIRHYDLVCVNDHVHWLCFTDPQFKSLKMVALDLSAETFREIPLPDSIQRRGYRFMEFSDFGGKLCVMTGVTDGECEVWVMDEYGVPESWVKHHAFSQLSGHIFPYGFTSHGELLFRVRKGDDRFGLYDSVAAKTKNFKIMSRYSFEKKFVEYVDSLVWIAPASRI